MKFRTYVLCLTPTGIGGMSGFISLTATKEGLAAAAILLGIFISLIMLWYNRRKVLAEIRRIEIETDSAKMRMCHECKSLSECPYQPADRPLNCKFTKP